MDAGAFIVSPCSGRLVATSARKGPQLWENDGMMNSVLALLTVVAVLAVTALIKLPLLPFRLIGRLMRSRPAAA
jgi:hypothetical protein